MPFKRGDPKLKWGTVENAKKNLKSSGTVFPALVEFFMRR